MFLSPRQHTFHVARTETHGPSIRSRVALPQLLPLSVRTVRDRWRNLTVWISWPTKPSLRPRAGRPAPQPYAGQVDNDGWWGSRNNEMRHGRFLLRRNPERADENGAEGVSRSWKNGPKRNRATLVDRYHGYGSLSVSYRSWVSFLLLLLNI